ncbi:MAG: cation:proton antiporter [Candidatus Acetothermia bacterium]|jgi:multicomponent Na+:H+ antiporter subunit F|nr:cation:proton antiporter [Candidatus Acetothermia bacterium]MDH7505638.1 cation:proton antiporter [Candidatus Acetothermia bacterium]
MSAFAIAAIFLGFYMLFCLIRVAAGPTVPDRVVGVDTINTLVVALMVLLGTFYKEVIFIDVAIVYALLSYIATLYIAKYLEGSPW